MTYSIVKNLKIKNAGEEVLLYDQSKDLLHVINESALFVLQSITKKSMEEIKNEMAEMYDVDPEEVKEDIQEIIKEFLCKGILLEE